MNEKDSNKQGSQAATGYKAKAHTEGDYTHATATDGYAKVHTEGLVAHATATGNESQVHTEGPKAHAAATGSKSQVHTKGLWACAAATGDEAEVETKGKNSIACAIGAKASAKAIAGSWIILADWQVDEQTSEYQIKGIYSAQVGQGEIKGIAIEPGVKYSFKNGELICEK